MEQLKNLIFPDPQWLIMLVKEDLQSHLKFKKEFRACNMNVEKFDDEKRDLVEKGLLSESLLRCIWFDAIPEAPDCKKLVALLYHFDVGFKMTVKEAEFQEKDVSKNYTLIPALIICGRQRLLQEIRLRESANINFTTIVPTTEFTGRKNVLVLIQKSKMK